MRGMRYVDRDLSFTVAEYRFGFVDMTHASMPPMPSLNLPGFPDTPYTEMHVGPLGTQRVPVSAAGGWGLIAVTLIAVLMLCLVTALRRKRPLPEPGREAGG